MRWCLLGAAAVLLGGAQASGSTTERCFPDSFMFGSATASYQVEGAVKETGRTSSIWDDFCRDQPGLACSNVADDFLHRYKDDIQTMKDTGLQSFRFSISWSRVMNWNATSKRMVRNQAGIDFYHSMVDELLSNNLVPVLTLYHWDLPSELHTQLSPQGWLNSEIVSHFVEYSELIFSEFGSKVDYWTTFNEPFSFTFAGYGVGMHAPGFKNSTTNAYVAGHNLLNAHAQAVAKFRERRSNSQIRSTARIGIVLVSDWSYPLNASDPKDVAAAERRTEFMFGWYLKPIVTGDYPAVMREYAGAHLPTFTAEESALLKGSYDLFMMNYYSSKVVTDCDSESSTITCDSLSLGWERDMGVDYTRDPPGARRSALNSAGVENCAMMTGYAPGYLQQIKWLHKHDTSADILLTENGYCGNEEIESENQLWYFQTHIGQVYKAVVEEKIPVIGYTAWSLLDNYEWGSFNPRFGLYYVDMPADIGDKDFYTPNATQLTRKARLAGRWFSSLAQNKCLNSSDTETTEVLQSFTDSSSSAPTSTRKTGLEIVVVGLLVAVAIVVVVVIRRRTSARANERSPLLRTKQ